MPRKLLPRVLLVLVVVFALLQLVPYGRDHTNPAKRAEPAWDSPRTRELVVRACFDCHSNETAWPWYSHVAPLSWFVQSDVEEGREHLNFSEFDVEQKNADEAAEEVEKGEMPLWAYTLLHGEARLSDAEKAELVRGLTATLGDEDGRRHGSGRGPGDGSGGGRGGDDEGE